MKLNEKYQDYIIEKSEHETTKNLQKLSNEIIKGIKGKDSLTASSVAGIVNKQSITYSEYLKSLDAMFLLSPVMHYVSQGTDVRKSRITKGLRSQIKALFKDYDLNDYKKVVDRAFSITYDVDNGSKFDSTQERNNFVAYLNQMEPRRKSVLNDVVKKLGEQDKVLKAGVSTSLFKQYTKLLDSGFGKKDAIEAISSMWEVTKEDSVKTYFQMEAHEDFERIKIETAAANGFKHKYWRTQRDKRVRMSHAMLDGEIVEYDKPFKMGKERPMYPGDSSLPLGERINCRCFTEFVFVKRGTMRGPEIRGPEFKPPPPQKVFEPADNIDDAIRQLKDTNDEFFVQKSFSRLTNSDVALSSLNGFNELVNKYPILRKHPIIFEKTIDEKNVAGTYANWPIGLHELDPEEFGLNRIRLNKTTYDQNSPTEEISKSKKELGESGWSFKVDEGNELRYTVEHEIGHYINLEILQKEHFPKQDLSAYGIDNEKMHKQHERRVEKYGKGQITFQTVEKSSLALEKESASYYMRETFERYIEKYGDGRPNSEVYKEIREQMCQYGQQDPVEGFAELWTAWRLNSVPNKLAQVFGEYIGGILDELSQDNN